MKLARKKISDPIERQIVTGAVVSDRFLKEVRSFYHPHLMTVKPCRTVVGWCFDHLDQYGEAPREHVQDIFETHARRDLDEDEAEVIASILAKASEEFEREDRFNVDYLLDQAETFFKRESLRALAEDIKTALSSPAGGPTAAEQVLEEYHRIERPRSSGLCPFTNRVAIKAAFKDQAQPLFRYGGALGEMLNPMLTRAGFLALLAPPKRGKSWLLMELGLRALSAGCNVVHFECGDMTEEQWLRRFHVRLSDQPYRHYREDYQKEIIVPFLERSDPHSVVYRTEEVLPLSYREALQGGRRFLKRKNGKRFKLICHPSGTLTPSMVETQLDMWSRIEGFVPDVVLFDYADLLTLGGSGPKEYRHQQNEIWKWLRSLSQSRHALVVTATQSDSEGMKKKILTSSNFSEDMRKIAHVTGMYGLNQTPMEKLDGRLRLNEIVVREGDFNTTRSVTLLQSLQIGRPVLGSYWTPAPKEDDEENDE